MFYEFHHSGLSEHFCKEYGTNFNFPSHIHHSFELITVFSGEMTVTVNSSEYHLNSFESLLIFPNQLHSLQSIGSKHMLCIFSPELVQAFNSKTSHQIPKNNKFSIDKHLIDTLAFLDENCSVVAKKGILYSICDIFDRNAEYTENTWDNNNLLLDIFKYVELHFQHDCSLSALSKETGFSYSYISRYFKNIVGISYNTYLNCFRLNNACYLLKNTDYSILRCAYESGYTSLRSFNRNFKINLSMTPHTYRNNT